MVSQAETLRGKERIQQLMEEFPEVHRSLVVKADLLREAIRPSAATRQLGRWSLPDAHWYFLYDKEAIHTPEETAEGYTLTPVISYFPDDVAWQVMFDSRSPYEIRYEERGRYRLYRDGEPIEEMFFPPRPPWYDRKTSSGKPMPSVIAQRQEGRMQLAALTYCEYGKDDRLCRYCNVNASEPVKGDLGMERMTSKRDQDVYETFMAANQEGEQRHVQMSGGVLLDSSKEAANYARIAQALRRAMKDVGHECTIGVNMQATVREAHIKLKEAGVSSLTHNLEVWDPRLFEIICPGKAKYVGRERWMERLLGALEVFGEGRVNSGLIVGAELAHPDGFKSEDEAAASYLEGVEWLLSHGISSAGAFFRCVPGTIFAGMSSPRTEYSLRVELARYKMAVKLNKGPEPSKPEGPFRRTRSSGVSLFGDFFIYGLRGAPAAGASPASPSRDIC